MLRLEHTFRKMTIFWSMPIFFSKWSIHLDRAYIWKLDHTILTFLGGGLQFYKKVKLTNGSHITFFTEIFGAYNFEAQNRA